MLKARQPSRFPVLAAAIAAVGALTAPVAFAAPEDGVRARQDAPVAVPDDFNGDGHRDVVVTAPRAKTRHALQGGYVAVLYGSDATRPPAGARQVFDQDSEGIPGTPEWYDRFGNAVATADLDADGYTDLLVGAAQEDVGRTTDAGSLYVIWGGEDGLSGSAVLRDGGTEFGELGGQVVTGDFDGDGDQDVASTEAGDLRVFSGPFTRDGSAVAQSTVAGVPDTEIRDLAAGRIDGDGRTDIAAVWYGYGDVDEAGTTAVLMGTAQGPGPATVVGGKAQGGDNVAVGDVDGDGYDDLVVGRSLGGDEGDGSGPAAEGGMITFVPGSARGPAVSRARSLNQDSAGVPGAAEQGDGFGRDVSVGDVDGDRYADLAVGVPGEDLGKLRNAGAVAVLRGTKNGPTGTGAKVFTQDTKGVPGAAEADDAFGSATKLADTDDDGRAELFASAVHENASNGSVWVFGSAASGVTAAGTTTFGGGTLGARVPRAHLGASFND